MKEIADANEALANEIIILNSAKDELNTNYLKLKSEFSYQAEERKELK